MPSTEQSFYLLNTCTVYVIFLYNCMQCIDGSSILLQRYVTKGNDAKNPAFLAFVCYRKNPVKCNACAVAQKIETDCFSRNVPFSRDPVVRISRNLAKNRSETTRMALKFVPVFYKSTHLPTVQFSWHGPGSSGYMKQGYFSVQTWIFEH